MHAIFRMQCGNNICNCVYFLIVDRSRNSLVGTATRLWFGRSGVRIQVGLSDFSGATPVAYSMGVALRGGGVV